MQDCKIEIQNLIIYLNREKVHLTPNHYIDIAKKLFTATSVLFVRSGSI